MSQTSAADRQFQEFMERASQGLTGKLKTKAQLRDFHRLLEAERFDVSYRTKRSAPTPARKAAPAPKPVVSPADHVARMKRDKNFYDAGRFAQGARDPEAVAAFEAIHGKGTN